MTTKARHTLIAATSAVLLVSAGSGLQAQSLSEGWEGYIGIGASSAPTFSGSDETKAGVAVDVDLTWNQRVFLRSDAGVGFYALNGERSGSPLTLGFGIGYDFDERLAVDDARLTGLTDIESGATFNAFLEYELGLADLEVLASRGLGSSGHEGTTVEFSIGFDLPVSDRTIVSISPFATWADDTYTSAFYGVSAAESLASGYGPYTAGAGLMEAGLEVTAVHFLNDSFGLLGQVEYSNLLGDAQDSPLTFQDDALEVAVGVLYRF